MASKRHLFEERFFDRASLSFLLSSLDLCPSIGLFGTSTSWWSSLLLSGPTAFSHYYVDLWWSTRDLHVPRFFFFIVAHVGYGFLFLVLVSSGDGFRRSVVTGVVLCTAHVVPTLAMIFIQRLVWCFYCVSVYCNPSCIIFIFFKFVYGFSDTIGLF